MGSETKKAALLSQSGLVAENLSNGNTFEGDLLLISTMNEEYGPPK